MNPCNCEWCTHWHPLIKRIDAALPADLRKDFDSLLMHHASISEDSGANAGKLAGTWPGWEWIIEAKKQHGVRG